MSSICQGRGLARLLQGHRRQHRRVGVPTPP